MSKDRFDLHAGSDKTTGDSQEAQIEELRALARSYRDANNVLVEKLWGIEQKLLASPSAEAREALLKEKEEITNQSEEARYIEQFNALLEEIKTLEIALHGHSDVGSDSPYQL